MSEQLLQVRNLSVSVEDKPILHGIDLEVRPGETHVCLLYTSPSPRDTR